MDGDMNDIFQKLNTILEDKDMSNNLKNIISNFSSSTDSKNNNEESNSNCNYSNNDNSSNSTNNDTKSDSGIPEFDINTILKIKKIMDSLHTKKDDPRSNLLRSLKPYLSESKKDKIDNYIKFLQLATVFENINPLSGDEIKNE